MKLFKLTTFILVLLSVSIPTKAQQAKVLNLDSNVYAIHLMGYTSLVVEGSNEVLITDPANPYRANLLKNEIKKLTNKPVKKIVLTHEHFDHVGGTEIFEHAQIIAQQNIQAIIDLDPLDIFPNKVDIMFDELLVLDMGTTSIHLKHYGFADGVAAILVYLPKEKIALSADLYTSHGLSAGKYLTNSNLLGIRRLLNILLSWDLKHAINAHSSETDIKSLANMTSFYNDLYNTISASLKQIDKYKAFDLMAEVLKLKKTIKLPKYEKWENYQDLPLYIEKMGFAIIHGG